MSSGEELLFFIVNRKRSSWQRKPAAALRFVNMNEESGRTISYSAFCVSLIVVNAKLCSQSQGIS